MKILLLEDDLAVRDPLAEQLRDQGYTVVATANLREARAALADPDFQLMIFDWQLPDGQGVDLIKELRAKANAVPVILLTARTEVTDRVLGLELGADDYLTKPFDVKELIARVRARTRTPPRPTELRTEELALDPGTRTATHRGQELELTKMEFDLLRFFLENEGKALGRDEILNKVWGYENFPTSRTVDAHVVQLRQKIDPAYLETLRGVGYRFKRPRS